MPSHKLRRDPLPPDYQFPTPKTAARLSLRFVKQYDIVTKQLVPRWNAYVQPCSVCGLPVLSQGFGNVIMSQTHTACLPHSADATGAP